MLQNLFSVPTGSVPFTSLGVVVFNLILAFVLSLLIAIVYKSTHRGLSYSQTFVLTLILSGVVIGTVMMVIGNNVARAFGAFGAFSLIRFRTAIKDAKDMGYIFFVLAVGMAVGTNNYLIALTTTLFVSAIILGLTKFNFGSLRRFDYILSLNLDTQVAGDNIYKTIFDKYLRDYNVLNIKAIQGGKILQMNFSIKFIDEKDLKLFVAGMEGLNGVNDVNLITAKNDVEY